MEFVRGYGRLTSRTLAAAAMEKRMREFARPRGWHAGDKRFRRDGTVLLYMCG